MARMFNGRPPRALLTGLASKSKEMHDLCNEMLLRLDEDGRDKAAKADRDAWLLRRDMGNRRAAEQREIEAVRAKEAAKRYNNSGYVDEDESFRGMKSVWDKQLEDYIRRRDASLHIT